MQIIRSRNSAARLARIAALACACLASASSLLAADVPAAEKPYVKAGSTPQTAAPQPDFAVTMIVDRAKVKGDMKPFYRFFGADEPNYAYMKDGLKLLGDIGGLGPAQPTLRAQHAHHRRRHAGLKWGSTNIYTEDAKGNPVYDFTIVDRIFDAYLKNGVKPYAEIGFMPAGVSTHPEPYQHYLYPVAAVRAIRSSPAGPILQKATTSGASWFLGGLNIAWRSMEKRKSSNGIGKSGTNPTSAIGREPRRSSSSCKTMRSTA